ncbi:MAG: 1-deoxy-D-xylulose-5-phosphate reductoisomerase [Firmicutes bacterium]|nr:1-deoxy-D-xylulose-5-phosphate reductoisomerase [Bacillota bacterium]
MRSVIILGATGSIGRQTQEVLRAFPSEFVVEGLSAHSRMDELVVAARALGVKHVVVQTREQASDVQAALPHVTVRYGVESLVEMCSLFPGALVVNALLGAAGVRPTLTALQSGCDVALANKETLVAAGEIVMKTARLAGQSIIPIDSEHSAIWQCLRGSSPDEVERLVLTASGGPFRDTPVEQLARVTVAEALRHPTWQMGAKISIDSATLMNKGFEVIEAHHLYQMSYDKIDVIVHPQSVIHSLVEFVDGALLAQLGTPDMRTPITYALFAGGQRRDHAFARLRLSDLSALTFVAPDTIKFPALALAYTCGRQGGTAPAVMNAANEVAVDAFLHGRMAFTQIYEVVERVVQQAPFVTDPQLDDVLVADREARAAAERAIEQSVKHV